MAMPRNRRPSRRGLRTSSEPRPVSSSVSPSAPSISSTWHTMRPRRSSEPSPFTRRSPNGHIVPQFRWWIGGAPKPAASVRPDHESDFVLDAPAPVLARLDRAQDGVVVLLGVTRRVAVRRAVAAADLPALLAHPQVHPRRSDLQAFLAALHVLRRIEDPDVVEVGALDGHAVRS